MRALGSLAFVVVGLLVDLDFATAPYSPRLQPGICLTVNIQVTWSLDEADELDIGDNIC
jgi:hypothetical protein